MVINLTRPLLPTQRRVATLLLLTTLLNGAALADKARLPSFESIGGDWVGLDVRGSVCRLVLESDGSGGAVTCDHHGTLTVQKVANIELQRFKVVIDLQKEGAYDETRLKGTVAVTSLELEFLPSRMRVDFFRADRVMAGLHQTKEEVDRVLGRTR